MTTTLLTAREVAQQFVADYENGDLGDLKHYARHLRAALAQEEQEPVAWIHKLHHLLGHAENMPPADRALALGWEPLYTAPPRRPWQSLTEEEREQATGWSVEHIEAKLKEKNND